MITTSSRPLLAGTALLLGPAVYLVAEAASAAAWSTPAYSYVHNWISDLGSSTQGVFEGRAINSPLHPVMNAGFLVSGLLLALGLLLVSRGLPTRLRRTTVALTTATTTGYALLATFQSSAAAAADGTLALHFLGAALAIIGANTLAVLLGAHWWKDARTRSLGHASLPLGLLGLLAVVLLVATMGSSVPAGLVERVAVYTAVLWQIRVALHVLLAHRGSPDPARSAQLPAASS